MTYHAKTDSRKGKITRTVQSKSLALKKRTWHFARRFKSATSRVAFIVGSGRSGTDILAHNLNQASSVELINEGSPLAFENWRLKELFRVRQIAERRGAPLVVMKPIVETIRLPELLQQFPDSRALFIFRDYRDAINSMIRFFGAKLLGTVGSWVETDFARQPSVPSHIRQRVRELWKPGGSVADAAGLYWYVYNSSFLFHSLDQDSRVLLVEYERLVRDSERELRRICNFLNIRYS